MFIARRTCWVPNVETGLAESVFDNHAYRGDPKTERRMILGTSESSIREAGRANIDVMGQITLTNAE